MRERERERERESSLMANRAKGETCCHGKDLQNPANIRN